MYIIKIINISIFKVQDGNWLIARSFQTAKTFCYKFFIKFRFLKVCIHYHIFEHIIQIFVILFFLMLLCYAEIRNFHVVILIPFCFIKMYRYCSTSTFNIFFAFIIIVIIVIVILLVVIMINVIVIMVIIKIGR